MGKKRNDVEKPQPRRSTEATDPGSNQVRYEQFHKDRLVQSLVAMVIITAIFYAVWM